MKIKKNNTWGGFFRKNPPSSIGYAFPDITSMDIDQLSMLVRNQFLQIQELNTVVNSLTESNERYQQVYINAPFAYFLINKDGIILDSNITGRKLLGINEKSRSNLLHCIPDEFHSLFLSPGNERNQFSESTDEIHMIHCPSEPTYVKVTINPLHDNNVQVIMWDVTRHRLAEEELAEYQNNLEEMISERTSGLLAINELLKKEIIEKQTAREALAKSENRYRLLMDTANSIIIRMNDSGIITFFNLFAQRFFGYSEEEIIGRNAIGTIVPETDNSGHDLIAMMNDLIKHPDKYPVNENENIRRNGERAWVSWTNKGFFDENSNLIEILSIGTDITEQKRISSALECSQRNMKAILNSPAGPIVLLNRKGEILEINEQGARKFNKSRESLLGKNLFHTINNSFPDASAYFKQVLESGKSCTFEVETNGEIHNNYLFPIRDTGTEVDRIAMFSFDITLIKKNETILHETEERYRQLVESVNTIIVRVAPDGTIKYINDYGLVFFGYSQKELIGKNVMGTIIPLTEPGDRNLIMQIDDVLSNPENHTYNENINIRKDGTRVWIAWANKPLYDSSGHVSEILGVGNDITRLKIIENELRESEEISNAILNSIPERIMLITTEGTIIAINTPGAEMLGKTTRELIGTNILSFLNEEEALSRFNKFQQVTITRKPVRYEVRDNNRIYYTSLSPVTDDTGKVIQLVVYTHDITEIRKLEREIFEISENNRLRLGEAIHGDLGQYLAAIGFLSRALYNRCHGNNPDNDRLMEEICAQASDAKQHARSLARGLYSTGLTPATFQDALNDLCSTVEKVYGIQCSLTDNNFHPTEEETSGLYSIIQEGILNSVSHGRGNEINIQLLDNYNWRGIKITDNGIGFSTDTDDSLGMGLRLMRYRAVSINAKLNFRNNDTKGATLSIELPAKKEMKKGE